MLGDCLFSNCKFDLPIGVPNGSVLSPVLPTVYTTPLSCVISGRAIPHHLHAVDAQCILSIK